MDETRHKLRCLRELMTERGLDGIVLSRSSNFAWLTGGAANYVNVAVDSGPATVLITATEQHIVVSNIEATRMEAEEGLRALGFTFHVAPWYETNPALERLTTGLRLGSDVLRPGATLLADDLKQLRLFLLPAETERLRLCARACAGAMEAAIARVRPGMSEYEIAGLLAGEALAREAWPIVDLVATDERIYRFRHPLPTGRRLERYAMLVLSGRRRGVVTSITRLVHFGPLPDELQRKQAACALVDATLIAHTRPGRRVGDIFQAAAAAYAQAGYPGEWQNHHQGGPVGYDPREYPANAGTEHRVIEGQAYAWNPSISGVKLEDTILVGGSGNEVLTAIPGWPAIEVPVAGQRLTRPAILEIRD